MIFVFSFYVLIFVEIENYSISFELRKVKDQSHLVCMNRASMDCVDDGELAQT